MAYLSIPQNQLNGCLPSLLEPRMLLMGEADNTSGVVSTPEGTDMFRSGPLRRGPQYYTGDPLAAFKKAKGELNPAKTPGLLTNPYRDDGTARLPGDLNDTGLYTTDNYWYDGNKVVQGLTGETYYRNESEVNIMIAGGLIPGNEQPGASITILPTNGQEIQALRPPKSNSKFNNGGQPEIYNSVGNIDPVDGVGWHFSNARPGDDPAASDYGTPQYAYKTDVISFDDELFAGLSTNEGYDPELSQNPDYGIALYVRNKSTGEEMLAGLVNINYVSGPTATARMWGLELGNPEKGEVGVVMQVGKGQFLREFGSRDNIEFVYVYKPSAEINAMIDERMDTETYITNTIHSVPPETGTNPNAFLG